jgi:hypothetical protein
MSQKYCVKIKKSKIRMCIEPDCEASAINKTDKCKIHGGGRCIEPNCKEHAIGKTYKCVAHSSNVARCIIPDCKDRVMGKTDYCSLHFLFGR